MIDELNFDIPATPENKKAFDELKKHWLDTPCTLYGTYENGDIFPIMNIEKHPDCPEGWYEMMLKRFLNFKED